MTQRLDALDCLGERHLGEHLVRPHLVHREQVRKVLGFVALAAQAEAFGVLDECRKAAVTEESVCGKSKRLASSVFRVSEGERGVPLRIELWPCSFWLVRRIAVRPGRGPAHHPRRTLEGIKRIPWTARILRG